MREEHLLIGQLANLQKESAFGLCLVGVCSQERGKLHKSITFVTTRRYRAYANAGTTGVARKKQGRNEKRQARNG